MQREVDDLQSKIIELLSNAGKDGMTISLIYKSLNVKSRGKKDEQKRNQIKSLVDRLVEERKVKRKGSRYYLVESANNNKSVPSPQPNEVDLKKVIVDTIREELRSIIEEEFSKFFGTPKTERDFDKMYEEVKDSLGFARLDIIRKQMGMREEEFYGKFRDHIVRNYQLIDGGNEGIVKGGKLYGIIRRVK